jgi:Reverse transcriptase (RNA-dependent DNA polymerase)
MLTYGGDNADNTSHVSFDFDQIHSPNDEIIPSMTNAIREELTQPSSRYNLRPNRGKPGRWANAYITQHEPLNKSIARLGTRAIDAIKAELSQMVSKQVWEPMPFAEMRHRKCISSKMFIKEKSDGRVKARLVAGGHQQDRGIYEDLSSPTVDTTSVFAMAAVAAEEERFVISIDFEAAYLNAELIPGIEVYMKLNKSLVDILITMFPELKKYVNEKGEMFVRLLRALYGCVESARQFNQHLDSFLKLLGYTVNSYDNCVYNSNDSNGVQCSICLHVDDLFVSSKSMEMIDALVKKLTEKYKTITVNDGPIITYLGMNFDFSNKGYVEISMDKYVDGIINEYNVIGEAASPAMNYLFDIVDTSPLVDESEKAIFHTITAKLLYLAKRIRGDLMTLVAYLTSRVLEPNRSDYEKLWRGLRYLNSTKNLKLRLSCERDENGNFQVISYIDSSFGVHADMKSHTGGAISLGKGFFEIVSSRQKINTKSSTEAELIGISDYITRVIHARNFLIDQGYKIGPAIIYQDNQSTMELAEKGGRSNTQRTRHINIRYFFITDRIKEGEVVLQYMPTDEMVADVLTKPLQGAKFKQFRKQLLNTSL